MTSKGGQEEIRADENWQVNCEELSARLGQVRDRGLWTDCEVSVGTMPITVVSAHRVLLAAASPVLASMLFDPFAFNNHRIALPFIGLDTFNIILEFIYTDKINITTCDVARSLYKAAKHLRLSKILSECKTYLTNSLCAKCAISVYQFANQHKEYILIEKSRKLICTETMTVLEQIEDADADTVADIFAMSHLVIDSELDLFRAAERWLEEQQTPLSTIRRRIDRSYNHINNKLQDIDQKTDIPEEPEETIHKVVQQIRFLTINPDEFAAYDTSSLLSESEMLAITLNLLSNDSHMPMPEGFSTSKEPRIVVMYCLFIRTLNYVRTFEIKINDVKNYVDGDDIISDSDERRIYNLPWKVQFKKLHHNAFLLYVKCNWNHEGEKWACTADVSIRAISKTKGVPNLLLQAPYTHRYHGYGMLRDYYCYRFSSSVSWSHLIDPTNGYVEDDSITIEARIAARPPVFNE